jgi:hypothetical protein
MSHGKILTGTERVDLGNNSFEFRTVELVDNATPIGLINGVNTTFTLPNDPVPGTVDLYLGGLRQILGVDYTLSSDDKTITMTVPPIIGAFLRVDYFKR